MTQEEKDLLLKDLCARLPYGVICDMWFERNESEKITEVLKCGGLMRLKNSEFDFLAKPYLRPMSSMTEEEEEEYNNLVDLLGENEPYFVLEQMTVDFYHKHHFDNRFLIPKGLAIEAPEDMYNNK